MSIPDTDPLITIDQAKDLLNVSRATVHRMLLAGDYDDLIRDGRKTLDDVPQDVRPYLGRGFPRRVRLGPRLVRLEEIKVRAWRSARRGGDTTEALRSGSEALNEALNPASHFLVPSVSY